jgi:divalent metal cation (Fe/Co/Zn/Cd) transporter
VVDEAYPAGRARLEPIAVVVCALLMGLGALFVIFKAVSDLIAFGTQGTIRAFQTSIVDLVLLVGTVTGKVVLTVWSKAIAKRTHNVTGGRSLWPCVLPLPEASARAHAGPPLRSPPPRAACPR